MKILRAFQIIKQDGMYKANLIYNTVDGGTIIRANERETMYLTEADMVSATQAIDTFLTGKINEV